jgi:N-acetylmuramoyl-L-alanine amidase
LTAGDIARAVRQVLPITLMRCLRLLLAAIPLVLLLLAHEAWQAPAGAEPAPRATAARVAGDAKRTRFVTDIERPLSFSAYVVADPYRVILDLPDVNFQLPAGSGTKGRGLVTGYRFGPIEPGKSRIIMDTKGPVLIDRAFITPAEDGQPARLVVDLIKTDKATFTKLIRSEAKTARAKTMPLPKKGPPTIIIDPGHGGIDPGATSVNGDLEKDIVLAFAQTLKTRLEKSGRYRVLMTREQDEFVTLDDRVAFARAAQADLFMAIHADIVRGASVRGATIYTLSETASDSEAEALASKENMADAVGGLKLTPENGDISSILIGLAQRDSANRSAEFAGRLSREMAKATLMTKKPLRSAGFSVLKSPDVPSVLVELGYLSDPSDAELLNSPSWRERTAKSIARAVDGHFGMSVAGAQ